MANAAAPPANLLPACDDCRKRKVRCDRGVPKCSNCQRSKMACVFTNEGKKPNTTRQLAEDVAGLNSRLSAIDDTNAKLLERIDALTAEVTRSRQSSPPNGTSKSQAFVSPGRSSPQSPDHPDRLSHLAQNGGGLSNVVADGRGSERFFGPTSTRALFHRAKDQVVNFIQSHQQREFHPSQSSMYNSLSHGDSPPSIPASLVFPELQRRVDFVDKMMDRSSDFGKDYEAVTEWHPLSLPPRDLLETSIGIFFEESNLERIIFQKEIVVDAVEQHYQFGNTGKDEAWMLAFNNIVVLSMSYRSKVTRNSQYMLSSIDYDLLASRVEAANHTIRRLETLSKPRVINVQALLTLSLVARKFFAFTTFETVFHRACQMAKDMGLQEGFYPHNMLPINQDERKNLMWALYAIDKQLSIIKDVPCQLYLFEFNIPLPGSTGDASSLRWNSIAFQLRLTTLLEELYKQLNSPQARRQSHDQRQKIMGSMDRDLNTWWEQNHNLITQYDASGSLDIRSLHLRYMFFSVKVLVHRSSEDEKTKGICLRYAVEALKTIQLLCSGDNLLGGGLLALDRLFRGCSIVSFYVVFENFVKSCQAGEVPDHLGLLMAFTNALALVALPKYLDSYFVRMHKALSWCTDIARILQSVQKAQAPFSGSYGLTGNSDGPPADVSYHPSATQGQYQDPYSRGTAIPTPAFASNITAPMTANFNSTMDFSSSSSSRPGSRIGLSDGSFVRSNLGSQSSTSSSNLFRDGASLATQGAPVDALTAPALRTSSYGIFDTMLIDQIDPVGQPGTSNDEFSIGSDFFDTLLRPNAYMDEGQFGGSEFP